MNPCYLVLADGTADPATLANTQAHLLDTGMHACPVSPNLSLFVAEGTPVRSVPGMGVILGHVFPKDGQAVRSSNPFPDFADPAQARKHLIERFWGPYLLIQPVDEHGGTTVLRDPSVSGDVPCFYSLRDGKGFITSDISLPERLGLYRRQVDWDAIRHRLSFPQLKSARTALAGVQELLPGCSLRLGGEGVITRLEWSPWDFVAPGARHADPREAATDIRAAVSSAVQALARIDQAVLLELSGGLDSSIVGACLRGSGARVVCTSLVTTVPGADERHYASQIANQLGVELHAETLQLDDARVDFALPPQCATPRIGTLQHAVDEIMLAAADRHGTCSFFSGGGGDTIFCHLDTAAPAVDAFRERGAAAGLAALQDLSALHQCTIWKAGRLAVRKMLRQPGMTRPLDGSFLSPAAASTPPDDHPWNAAPPDALPGDCERIRGLATCQAYRDSLARGMYRPARMPLLSQPVVEACLRAPTWMWIAEGRNRAVARAAFADLLPADILNRRSKGTFMSYLGAVYRRNRDRMRDYLLHGRLQEQGLLDADALSGFLRHDLPERGRSFTRIFDICMVENWVRHQSESPPPSAARDRPAFIARQCSYSGRFSGLGSSTPSSQNRNQSRFRS